MEPVECFWLEPTDETRDRQVEGGVHHMRIWRRADTGEQGGIQDFGPGAMWNAHWMPTSEGSVDGRYIVVRLPNGHEWAMDGPSSNCTRPGEPHDCWCRHGDPPRLTVDKNPEPGRSTCAAGAGSIQAGNFHGFLRDGILVSV